MLYAAYGSSNRRAFQRRPRNALCVLASESSNSMIKKRPTFATGHSLAGLPAVSKVLHTDERCELYSLTSAAGSETILLLVRGPDATPPDVRRLEEWWATQSPQLLAVKQVLRAEECP